MQVKELEDYVYQKYGLNFESFLSHSSVFILKAPGQKAFFAMLSQIKNKQAGIVQNGHITTLDLKCGDFSETIRDLPGFSNPFKVKGDSWVGIWLNQVNLKNITSAIDYAYKLALNQEDSSFQDRYVVLPEQQDNGEKQYKAQAIPFENHVKRQIKDDIPEKIHQMQEAYDYSVLPSLGRGKNFIKQGKIMADYEDDYKENYAFKRYYPVYHDMTVGQLRTYFTWRSKLRKGIYEKTSTSYVFVYIYELINNIGVKAPLDGYKKLKELYENYVQDYAPEAKFYLTDWIKDYAIIYSLDQEIIQKEFAKEIKIDQGYDALIHPKDSQAVAKAMDHLANYRGKNPLGKDEFNEIVFYCWKEIAQKMPELLTDIIASNFKQEYIPFDGAIFGRKVLNNETVSVDDNRKFIFKNNRTYYQHFIPHSHQKTILNQFLHEIDRLSRLEFKQGRQLKPNGIGKKILTMLQAGVKKYHQDKIEAAKPKITINFDNLNKIRDDASKTRESLLTDEEKELEIQVDQFNDEVLNNTSPIPEPVSDENDEVQDNDLDLTEDETYFVKALIKNSDWKKYLKDHNLMVSILADNINEKFFDEIGDNIIEFNENDQPEIIADYLDDVKDLMNL